MASDALIGSKWSRAKDLHLVNLLNLIRGNSYLHLARVRVVSPAGNAPALNMIPNHVPDL